MCYSLSIMVVSKKQNKNNFGLMFNHSKHPKTFWKNFNPKIEK